MRFVRQIIADRMSGGVLALLLSFMMMLDGAIGAHALGAMAAAERLAAAQIICSTDTSVHDGHGDAHGDHDSTSAAPVHHKHGGKAEHPECCSAACQFAAQVAATDLPVVLAPRWPVPSRAVPLSRDYAVVVTRPQGRWMAARGPPAFSPDV
ncbi:hypothetical protein GAO09_28465 [Rhizobiales bacterium RZME27]|jgi:hypothetical protein|uniref:DUF2946 domain-containing protein n=1 Tax=Endobacterium cereale TaxID=2663029 RepID=A0A6A8AJC3_9HYPH|nr:hypothetical protein [Endobacterium cereale]MEB2845863.1 hypothetical protein [Endobacterium cereale]MQY49967.1 hypothetical protein [Endobacterium cereale]